jgi:NAD(P)-dependent dehydrogenase (short-subunit alcohol dehydrogenase family)
VVNDLGGTTGGEGADAGPASAVAAEIVAAGGDAVADPHDVSTADGAQALVDGALDRFGRIDALINNAGIVRWAGFPDADADNLARHLAVHVFGAFHTTRAAWPHFAGQRSGRVVMTTSTGLLGLPNNVSYATAKAGLIGMTRSLATAGAPAAFTRLAGPEPANAEAMAPELVAPMAAFLAHASCPVSGEVYVAGFGRFARLFLATTPGYLQQEPVPTIEDVARNWEAINDERGYTVPADLMDWSAAFTAHLRAE